MKAPEKIYLQDSMSTDTIGDLWPEWFDAKVSDNSIEYTRTDVFVYNACDYLRNHIDKDLTIYHEQTWCKRDEFIKKFCKYMRGE